MTGDTTPSADQKNISRAERVFIWLFCACSVLLPLVFGELFPFSSAPMFRDQPVVYCEYQVTGPKGAELSLKDFRLQRNYDGNPPGMGAGVIPEPSFDQFGKAPSVDMVRAHVEERLRTAHPGLDYVDVRQRVIGSIDDDRVGVIRDETIRVSRRGQ